MAKKLLKRFLPEPHKFKEHPHLKRFGARLHDPHLWHLSRRSVPGAFSIGLFVAFVPLPGHMIMAAALAIAARVNLPIAVALVWVNNPFTLPPIFYLTYKLGAWVLREPAPATVVEPTFSWLLTELQAAWVPVLIGCLICGVAAAVAGNVFIRCLWRWHVVRSWQARKAARRRRRTAVHP
jgi:uncharacterized protein (DUF2062 family)